WLLRGVGSTVANWYLRDAMDGYDARFDRPDRNLYLDGYWQSERYFSGIRDVLLKELSFKAEPDAANREMLARISSTNAVCVHVRRGDYVGAERHGLCGLDYYREAMAWLQARMSGLEFFVFSD